MRIGLLAASRIASKALVAPAATNSRVQIGAVAARTMQRAREFAELHEIDVAYGSYEDMLADESLDSIYVSTPTSLHAPWSIQALRAGKHVLCEKPLAGNAIHAREMFEAADRSGKVLMEAFHWRFHPFADRMISEVGRLDRPIEIETEFSIPAIPVTDIRYQESLGGGALMDLGCYTVHWVRTLLGEPTSVEASMDSTIAGVDDTTTGTMTYSDGSWAHIRASMVASEVVCNLRAIGANGSVTADNPIHPYRSNRLAWEIDGSVGEEEVPGPTTFEVQLQSFVEAVENGGTRIIRPEDSIANMDVLDSMYRSAGMKPRP